MNLKRLSGVALIAAAVPITLSQVFAPQPWPALFLVGVALGVLGGLLLVDGEAA